MNRSLNDSALVASNGAHFYQLGRQDLCKYLNAYGAYIHVIKRGDDVKLKLNKIKEGKIPTPACAVGISEFSQIQNSRWGGRSGLVFSYCSPVVLACKRDMNTYVLRGVADNDFHSFSSGGTDLRNINYIRYGNYLRKKMHLALNGKQNRRLDDHTALNPFVGALKLRLKIIEIYVRRLGSRG